MYNEEYFKGRLILLYAGITGRFFPPLYLRVDLFDDMYEGKDFVISLQIFLSLVHEILSYIVKLTVLVTTTEDRRDYKEELKLKCSRQ